MAARDLYHDAAAEALQKDGWTITNDPLTIIYTTREVFVDLGLDRSLLALDRKGEKIAIEIKTFGSSSQVTDLHRAIGQYVFYDTLLKETDPDRIVFLAIDLKTYEGIFSEPIGELMIRQLTMRLVIFDADQRSVVKWIS